MNSLDANLYIEIGRLKEVVDGLERSHEAYGKRLDETRARLVALEEAVTPNVEG